MEMNHDEIQKIIQSAVSQAVHLKPSPETLRRIDTLQAFIENHATNEADDIKELKRLILGNAKTGEIGMKKMLEDVHIKFVQANGVISVAKLMLLMGGVSAMLYTFFRKF